MMRVILVCVSAFCMMLVACGSSPSEQAVAATSPVEARVENRVAPFSIGMNVGSVVYYSPHWVFVDAFKQSSPWISQDRYDPRFDTEEELELNAEGWPMLKQDQIAATMIFRDIDGHYPRGTYVCLYEGEGEIEFTGDATQLRLSAVEGGVSRIDIGVKPTNEGILLRIVRSNRGDPVRNIRVIMPGFLEQHEREPFHPLFIERLKGFSTLRFMDWLKTSAEPTNRWEDRTRMDSVRQDGPSGVALEYVAMLCNRVGADAWVCVPHHVDDAYLEAFARVLKEGLDPERRVFVELSNEIWNTAMPQAQWFRQRAEETGRSWQELYARRCVGVFKVFQRVFEDEKRVVRVIGSQYVNTYLAGQILEHVQRGEADVLAVAPYFSGYPDRADPRQRLTIDAVLDLTMKDMRENTKLIAENVKLARSKGLELVAYEGGQHLLGHGNDINDEALTKAMIGANRSPEMGAIYEAALQAWRDGGGGMYAAYSYVYRPNRGGSWGVLEYQDQPTDEAPKYQALRRWISPAAEKPDFGHNETNRE